MAYGLKYFLSYKDNASGLPVVVNIYLDAYVGASLQLIPADIPCNITETNSTEKIFSAIRAKEYRIKFVTDNLTYPGINQFATNSDTDWKVEILLNAAIWLTGFILTDQISEVWLTDGTNHYIELVATDNLGTLKKQALKKIDGTNFTPTSTSFLIDLVKPCLQMAVGALPIYIFDNLFEQSFSDRTVLNTNDSYQQCKVDIRSFITNFDTFENAYSVLTKILESRNSVLFQHLGAWYIIRVSELFYKNIVSGTRYNVDGTLTAVTDASWTATVSQSGDIIPVDQYMLKSFINPVKSNKVIYNYSSFDELFCNESLKRGAIELDTSTVKEYHVDCWNHYQGGVNSTTPATVLFRRREVIDAAKNLITENYIFLENQGAFVVSFVVSEGFYVQKDDKLNVKVTRRLKNAYSGPSTEAIMYVLLYADDSTLYSLNDNGIWYSGHGQVIQHSYSAAENTATWIDVNIDSDFIPKTGTIKIHLQEGSLNNFTGQETHFKDLKITYQSFVNGRDFSNTLGDYDQITIDRNYKDTADYEVFLSDSPKAVFKGALLKSDGLNLTVYWYENGAPLVKYPIKQWKAIDYLRMSARNMLKVDGSFKNYALPLPLLPLQKLTITNGDLSKRFMPLSIRDLNTSTGLFSGLFIEVYGSVGVSPFTLAGEFIDPTIFKFITSTFTQSFFVVGQSYNITGTTLNNVNVTVLSISEEVLFRSVRWTIYFNGFITNEIVTAANFVNPAVTEIALPTNTHKFDYILKSK